jgi:hypothetical protein
MADILVPDMPFPRKGPFKGMCLKQQTDPTQPGYFGRCTFKAGHEGPHLWERNAGDRLARGAQESE